MKLISGETYKFVAHYVNSGESATGLTVTFKIFKIGETNSSNISGTEMGDGLYCCSFEPSSDGEYVAVACTTGDADQADIPCFSISGVDTKQEIDDELSDNHGEGAWTMGGNLTSLLRLSSDEITAFLDNQARQPIMVFRGDSMTLDIQILDAEGKAVSLIGASATFTARIREDDENYVIEKSLTIIDPSEGQMSLTLNSSDTELEPRAYAADIEVEFSDGRVKTVWRSNFIVKWDVTR